jgi:CHAD domain-containing protein
VSPVDPVLGRYDPRDPESLHDVRVAARRQLALLGALRPCLPRRLWRETRRRLERLLRLSSAARDEQAVRARLRLAPAAPFDSRRFRRSLARAERRARRCAARIADVPRAESDRELRRAVKRASRRLQRRVHALVAGGGGFHRTRIHVKRLRYLVGALAHPPADLRARLERAQDRMGEIRDAELALTFLEACEELDVAQRKARTRRLRRELERAHAKLAWELGRLAPRLGA